MLKYQVKLNNDNIMQKEINWKEKYLEPNLAFISGVTSQSYHLEKYGRIQALNSLYDVNSFLSIETENVQRQGYVVVKSKAYDVISGTIVSYGSVESGETINFKCIYINGKYYYEKDGEYQINDFLVAGSDGVIETTVTISAASPMLIDTVYWIEDGFVNIDGNPYYYDRGEELSNEEKQTFGYEGQGILKYQEKGEALAASAITNCSAIEFKPYDVQEYKAITKFRAFSEGVKELEFNYLRFSSYYYYALYKNHYYTVKLSGDTYVCEIPTSAITNDISENGSTVFPLQYVESLQQAQVEGDTSTQKGESAETVIGTPLTSSICSDFYYLRDYNAFIQISGQNYYIGRNPINVGNGREIMIDLSNTDTSLKIGDVLTFKNVSEGPYEAVVYEDPTNGNEGSDGQGNGLKSNKYIVFNGNRYNVIENVCDKVVIDGYEYDIEYPVGKTASTDDETVNCIVVINDEQVPFKIYSTDGGEYAQGELQRYGLIVSNALSAATTAIYSIRSYDGVIIDGVKYAVKTNEDNSEYAEISRSNEIAFTVVEVMGSSLSICKPMLNPASFSNTNIAEIAFNLCYETIYNASNMELYMMDKVFGEKTITTSLPFIITPTPTSTNDYNNIFDYLTLLIPNGYIYLPLMLSSPLGCNVLQDDVVESQFYEAEKEKAITPIVDMEKDVYVPKTIDGVYQGSKTTMLPIFEIDINLHFRTRNLDSWKVNEGYNNISVSGDSDNWFITDYHPYRDIIENGGYNNILMETSDLMGLLNFTNDDVFYQKSKIARSFLRLSYYDSTDPQTQSLLATSCVFMDEHALYKKFIDNSRKNINDYGIVSEYTDEQDSGAIVTKISVQSEYLGEKGRGNSYINFMMSNEAIEALGSDSNRISSRLKILNKYETDTSSEGFYIYMFREYAENLRPKPIYMKVEFNHAGVGRTIPFVIPMKWSGTGNTVYPTEKLTLSGEDLADLKQGFPLAYIYAQTYIPLYAVYDYQEKEYVYVFDSRYVDVNENGVAYLNLFEMKIRNENDEAAANTDITASINVNEGQFPNNFCG